MNDSNSLIPATVPKTALLRGGSAGLPRLGT